MRHRIAFETEIFAVNRFACEALASGRDVANGVVVTKLRRAAARDGGNFKRKARLFLVECLIEGWRVGCGLVARCWRGGRAVAAIAWASERGVRTGYERFMTRGRRAAGNEGAKYAAPADVCAFRLRHS